nr:unnamed protein product [Spirometra erinaceieuropaei]
MSPSPPALAPSRVTFLPDTNVLLSLQLYYDTCSTPFTIYPTLESGRQWNSSLTDSSGPTSTGMYGVGPAPVYHVNEPKRIGILLLRQELSPLLMHASVMCTLTCYVEQLRSVMRNLRATSPRASSTTSLIPPDLDKCNYVWVRHDAVRRPLQQPYDGPYRVLRRSDKDVVIDRNGKTDTVSIDRVKPAYIDDSDHSSPQHCTPPQTVRPSPPTGDRPPPVRRTRSGRHAHWPDRFVAG